MNVEGDLRLQDVAGIVRRRGKVAGLVVLFVMLVSYWVAMALPNTYTSYSTVLVEPQSVNPDLVEAGIADSDLNERLHLMTAQILSRGRLSSTIDEFGLYEDESEDLLREEIVDLMRARIRVEPVFSDLAQGPSSAVDRGGGYGCHRLGQRWVGSAPDLLVQQSGPERDARPEGYGVRTPSGNVPALLHQHQNRGDTIPALQ